MLVTRPVEGCEYFARQHAGLLEHRLHQVGARVFETGKRSDGLEAGDLVDDELHVV